LKLFLSIFYQFFINRDSIGIANDSNQGDLYGSDAALSWRPQMMYHEDKSDESKHISALSMGALNDGEKRDGITNSGEIFQHSGAEQPGRSLHVGPTAADSL
jgi:hypothetical protein